MAAVALAVAVAGVVWSGRGTPVAATTTQPIWNPVDAGLPTDPQPRGQMAAVYDPQLGGILVLGGEQAAPACSPVAAGRTVDVASCDAQNQADQAVCDTVGGDPGSCGGPSTPYQLCTFDLGGRHDVTDGVWIWRGEHWSQVAFPGGPGGLDEAAAVYDPQRGEVVLLGAVFDPVAGGIVMQTWTLAGSTWTLHHPAGAPSGRYGFSHALTFDPNTGRALLFGGFNFDPATNRQGYLGDTWSWDGSTWSQLQPAASPSPRGGAAMAFDPTLGRTVLVGGQTGTVPTPSGSNCINSGETWAWNGATWSRLPVTGPPARSEGSLAYSTATHSLILFGGLSADCGFFGPNGYYDCHGFGDTWAFDGTWHSPWRGVGGTGASHVHPAIRWDAGMVADPETQGVLLFGGTADVTSSDGDTWMLRQVGIP